MAFVKEKNREPRWGDIKPKQQPDGKDCLEYSVERHTNTRSGSDPRDTRKVKPRMYSTPGQTIDRDPVHVYKSMHARKRPGSMKIENSLNNLQTSLLLRPSFDAQPIGVNIIFLKEILRCVGLRDVVGNHEKRKALFKGNLNSKIIF